MATRDGPAPWERQRGESAKAFAAFCGYRDMGPRRSLRELARALSANKTTTYLAQLGEWSRRWNWVERVKAWDEELDKKAREAQLEEVRKMRERHVREAMSIQEMAIRRLKGMDPTELSANDVLRYFVEGTKLERISRGEPETIQEHHHTGKDGGPIEIHDAREELTRRINSIAARVGAQPVPEQPDESGS